MRFSIEELNPGVWIDINPDKPGQGRLCLRNASVELLEKLDKKHTKKQTTYHRHQPVTEDVTDDAAYKRDLWDYSIVDWEGICAQDGSPIPCTTDNKVALIAGAPLFLQLYNRCLDRVTELSQKQAEDEEGN